MMFPTGISYVTGEVTIRREHTRSNLAYIVVSALVVLALVVSIWLLSAGVTDAVVTGVFAPIVAVAGTVLGFYFGSEKDAG